MVLAVMGWGTPVYAEGDVTVISPSSTPTASSQKKTVAADGTPVVHKSLHKKKHAKTATASGATAPPASTAPAASAPAQTAEEKPVKKAATATVATAAHPTPVPPTRTMIQPPTVTTSAAAAKTVAGLVLSY